MVALLAKKLDKIADKKILKFADKKSANALWAAVRKRRDGIEDCSHTRDLQSASGKTSGLRRGKKPKKAQPKKDTRTLDLFSRGGAGLP